MKFDPKVALKSLDQDTLEIIADTLIDIDDSSLDSKASCKKKIKILIKKFDESPPLSKKNTARIISPLITLMMIDSFYNLTMKLERDVNKKWGTDVKVWFPRFDSDDHSFCTGDIEEILADHLQIDL